jgi:Ca2+:H+ antiporter
MRGDMKRIAARKPNILFVFVVIGFIVQYTNQTPSVIFAINLIAVLPSSLLMGIGLKAMKTRYGAVVQAILYMTFGYVGNAIPQHLANFSVAML